MGDTWQSGDQLFHFSGDNTDGQPTPWQRSQWPGVALLAAPSSSSGGATGTSKNNRGTTKNTKDTKDKTLVFGLVSS